MLTLMSSWVYMYMAKIPAIMDSSWVCHMVKHVIVYLELMDTGKPRYENA